jgi:3'-5' exoribonuclease
LEYTRRIDYSDEGRLLSHIIIGLSMLDEKLKQVPDFPDLQAQLLKHMIVSHHGSRAFGSPSRPKPSRRSCSIISTRWIRGSTAFGNMWPRITSDGSWTPYHRLLERHFYKGPGPLETE